MCDLKHHKVYDVVPGRSEAALEEFFARLPGKEPVRVVCIVFSSTYRALIPKHFPNTMIMADRFQVILRPDQQLKPQAYLTAHPAIQAICDFHCRRLIPLLLRRIGSLKQIGFDALQQLGRILESWKEEIARMWRFTKTTALPRTSTTRWECSPEGPSASATSKTKD